MSFPIQVCKKEVVGLLPCTLVNFILLAEILLVTRRFQAGFLVKEVVEILQQNVLVLRASSV